jgi:hypothetical protein
VVGFVAFRAGARVGGIAVSGIVGCGALVCGAGAESNVVTLSLTTQLQAIGADSVLVSTTLSGKAQTLKGVTSSPVSCTTYGALEERIAELLQQRLVS